jgi:peptidoglycan/LPS O-acetylase OafA/YrhL
VLLREIDGKKCDNGQDVIAHARSQPRLSAKSARNRNEQLDMLRGIAILLVLCHHIFTLPPDLAPWTAASLSFLKSIGWVGVDLFFVLSGFLVSGLIFTEFQESKSFQPGRFLIRRGFKIYPSYYVLIAISVLLIPHDIFDPGTRKFVCFVLVFLQNYHLNLLKGVTNALFLHTWSLAVEEHFYFGLSFLSVVLLKQTKSFKLMPVICTTICFLVLIMRAYTFFHPPSYAGFADYATHLRIDALSFGVLLSYMHHHHKNKLETLMQKSSMFFALVALICILPCTVWGYHTLFTYVFGLTLLYLGFGIIMMMLIYMPMSNPLSKALAFVGFYSYSIYLWHRVVLLLVEAASRMLGLSYAPKIIVYFLCSVLIGILFSRAIEIPFLTLRNKMFPSRTKRT